MRRTVLIGAGLLMLSGCGGDADAVGENSAGSVKTTAVGRVIATPSPTATAMSEADSAMNAADAVANDAGEMAGNAM